MRGVEGMRQRYQAVLQEVHLAVAGITGASSEIANGNQDLSARTELAASNLQQTAQSMDELTASVRRSAQSAEQANRLAGHAGEVAALGGSQVAEVVATMGEIHESSRRIQDIIGVIDGIAFQTNILALNAAVEAARAGEQGRGFAVVASEVRALAGRSADAAKEIKALIGASASKANAGAQRVQQAGATVGDIVRSVRQVETIVGEITATTSEQSGGIGQVNLAMAQLEQATQQNAALVEQSTAAAQSLRDQANRLAAAVAVFKVTDEYPARVFPDSALATTLRLSGCSESP
jgi:methyl-accepting chemotaxis protein-2 (aspartate sensor receptor)